MHFTLSCILHRAVTYATVVHSTLWAVEVIFRGGFGSSCFSLHTLALELNLKPTVLAPLSSRAGQFQDGALQWGWEHGACRNARACGFPTDSRTPLALSCWPPPPCLQPPPCDCSCLRCRTSREERVVGAWGVGSESFPLLERTPFLPYPLQVHAFPPCPEEPSAKRGFPLPLQGPGSPRMGEPTQEEPQAGVLGTASLPEALRPHTSQGGLSGTGAVTIIHLVTSPAPQAGPPAHVPTYTPQVPAPC